MPAKSKLVKLSSVAALLAVAACSHSRRTVSDRGLASSDGENADPMKQTAQFTLYDYPGVENEVVVFKSGSLSDASVSIKKSKNVICRVGGSTGEDRDGVTVFEPKEGEDVICQYDKLGSAQALDPAAIKEELAAAIANKPVNDGKPVSETIEVSYSVAKKVLGLDEFKAPDYHKYETAEKKVSAGDYNREVLNFLLRDIKVTSPVFVEIPGKQASVELGSVTVGDYIEFSGANGAVATDALSLKKKPVGPEGIVPKNEKAARQAALNNKSFIFPNENASALVCSVTTQNGKKLFFKGGDGTTGSVSMFPGKVVCEINRKKKFARPFVGSFKVAFVHLKASEVLPVLAEGKTAQEQNAEKLRVAKQAEINAENARALQSAVQSIKGKNEQLVESYNAKLAELAWQEAETEDNQRRADEAEQIRKKREADDEVARKKRDADDEETRRQAQVAEELQREQIKASENAVDKFIPRSFDKPFYKSYHVFSLSPAHATVKGYSREEVWVDYNIVNGRTVYVMKKGDMEITEAENIFEPIQKIESADNAEQSRKTASFAVCSANISNIIETGKNLATVDPKVTGGTIYSLLAKHATNDVKKCPKPKSGDVIRLARFFRKSNYVFCYAKSKAVRRDGRTSREFVTYDPERIETVYEGSIGEGKPVAVPMTFTEKNTDHPFFEKKVWTKVEASEGAKLPSARCIKTKNGMPNFTPMGGIEGIDFESFDGGKAAD